MPGSTNSVHKHALKFRTFAVSLLVLVLPVLAVAQSTPEPAILLLGELVEDGFGASVAMAGDVNEDGWWDYLFSAPSDDDVAEGSGQVYLFYGPLTGAFSAADADASIRGEAIVDGLGRAVADAGDMNNDGFDDIVITSRSNDGNGRQAGRVYIFYGPIYGTMSASLHSTTTIRCSLPARGKVEVIIYDVLGRQVTTLLNGESAAGPNSVTWNGLDATGRQLATGLYFVRLRWGSESETRKLVLIR